MPLRHIDRVAGVIGVNTPDHDRLPADPVELFRKRFGDRCISFSFRIRREPDKIFGGRVKRHLTPSRKPLPRKDDPGGAVVAGVAIGQQPGLSADDRAYDAKRSAHADPVAGRKKVFVDAAKTGFTGGISWHRNFSRNWRRSEGLDHTVRVSLMIMAENDAAFAAVGRRRHGEDHPRSGKISVRDSMPLDAAGKAGQGQRQADQWRKTIWVSASHTVIAAKRSNPFFLLRPDGCPPSLFGYADNCGVGGSGGRRYFDNGVPHKQIRYRTRRRSLSSAICCR
jgi:non-specific protein-tyrosine kinase